MSAGILLVNLGTPDAPTPSAVRRYLAEFLSDPLVLTMNPLGRWLLLHVVILPFRSPRSAAAYASIWSEEGSPLLVQSEALTEAVRRELVSANHSVALAMRYGSPSLASGLEALRGEGTTRLLVAPLYPQYATSTTLSSRLAVEQELQRQGWDVPTRFIEDFYAHPAFIEAAAEAARPAVEASEHLLLSFHGLPESQVTAPEAGGAACLRSEHCCNAVTEVNRRCYRAQCYATARAMAAALGLDASGYSVSFQSRLGPTRWIGPYTDRVLPALAHRGVRKLAVAVPSFVADCLETLEEIGIRGRAQFLAAGGEAFTLAPCVNTHPLWVRGLARFLLEQERIEP